VDRPVAPPLPDPEAQWLIGDLEIVGQLPRSSNGTFLVRAQAGLAVYKPGQLERPLWDFPDGLYRRERAAFLVSRVLGWDLVPATVVRDGPLGPGSVQEFIPADFSQNYFTLIESWDTLEVGAQLQLLRIALFDLVVNNADRKAGHVLVDFDDRIWAIDNGLSFHVEPKLRTVIWELGGVPIPTDMRQDLAHLAAELPAELYEWVSEDAVTALRRRAVAVAGLERYLEVLPEERPYPWPLF
jgi:uncharacterized repeat protein (TIGR03843 family)